MSILELEDLASIPDTLPYCPVKEAELTLELNRGKPLIPGPVIVSGEGYTRDDPELPPRSWWQYRVCGTDQLA